MVGTCHTFHLKTFGCQMNVYDGIRINTLLTSNNMVATENETNADIIILNTCYIREKASAKIFSELGRLKKLYIRAKKKQPVFAVIGCVAKAEGKKIFTRAPYVSIVLSSQKYHLLPEMLFRAIDNIAEIEHFHTNNSATKDLDSSTGKCPKFLHLIDTELSGLEKFDCLPQQIKSDYVAFVQVQEGCDNFCTYCVVPNTRGREVSRPISDVVAEVSHLASLGAIEVNLLGQNVDSYNGLDNFGTPSNLAALIKQIAQIDGIKRIRYTTSYPSKISDDMITLHATESKLMPLVYLPIQAGSDTILHRMNRKYTRAQYLDIITKLKSANPNIQISSDFIVGFPGETEDDFAQTLDIVNRVHFIQCYAFKYSPRPDTPAAIMPDQIVPDIKSDRLRRLQSALRKSQDSFNRSCIGRDMSVLFLEQSKVDPSCIIGKNEYLQPVIVKATSNIIGKICTVHIKDASYANLIGELID